MEKLEAMEDAEQESSENGTGDVEPDTDGEADSENDGEGDNAEVETEGTTESAARIDIDAILEQARASEAFADNGTVAREPIRQASRATIKGPARKFGGVPPVDMAELFTPDGIGQIMADGVSSFYEFCEEPRLDEKEEKTTRQAIAYYMQMRLPSDISKYQPEMVLAAALVFPLLRRSNGVAKKTAPLRSTLLEWTKGVGSTIKGYFVKEEKKL